MKQKEELTVGTYKAKRSDINKARIKAVNEGTTLSSKIKQFVEEYASSKKKSNVVSYQGTD